MLSFIVYFTIWFYLQLINFNEMVYFNETSLNVQTTLGELYYTSCWAITTFVVAVNSNSIPVAQMVEQSASKTRIVGLIPSHGIHEMHDFMQCKSFWINES